MMEMDGGIAVINRPETEEILVEADNHAEKTKILEMADAMPVMTKETETQVSAVVDSSSMAVEVEQAEEVLNNQSYAENAAAVSVDIPTQEKTSSRVAYRFIKRAFDFISSLAVSVILLLPMMIVAALIMLKDHGSPFYFQKRVGKNNKPLYIAKFRSMRKGADNLEKMLTPEQLEEYKREYKLDDDPRLIGYKKTGDGKKCFGARLRQMSIDELPQILWNICIKGNMSVVGPRPILQSELEENYTKEQQEMLLSVKPGLTGYWQAYARNNAEYKDGKRQRMELYYVSNAGVLLDVKVLIATVGSVIRKNGAK